ncbi:41764ad2-1199-4992-8db0-0c01e283c18f [Sclerotinia trifoliorum]|uniref:41764ad2-1199-4992-8db0-0c01e283c18f n=1 Tax=Sclerotinia trifoliorum TaxID=28548 RepID=A0A8H2ZM88_9HELO|nr:41764ad2-1199-4992-8db0-0c01e283c18f [Sclerotinia trifoliorum]
MENQSKRKSNATMRTYSKRTRGSNQNFPIKRQRVDSSEFVSVPSPVLSESSIPPESNSEDKFDGENQSSLLNCHSQQLLGDIRGSSSIESRVLSHIPDTSVSPLAELESNNQNRRDHEISHSNSPDDALNHKSSTTVKGTKLTSTKEISNFVPERRPGSIFQHSKDSITPEPSSPTQNPNFSIRGNLASNHTSIDLDSLQKNTHKNTTLAPKDILVTSLSNTTPKEDTIVTLEPHSVETIKKSSIRNYFKPIPQPQRSSSPLKPQSPVLLNSPQKPISSPPSSPPPIPGNPLVSTKSKLVRRRISTKPNLPNINTMSDIHEGDLQELGGDFTDDARVELMERYHDAQDMRDHAIIDHGTLLPLADQPLDIPERAKLKADIARPMGFALHQQILDLGQSFHNKCQNCGMQYAINLAADQRLHDNFHKIFRMGGPTFKPKYVNTQTWQKVIESELHSIQCISYKESSPIRNLVESILEATLMDMDGILPKSEQLWSMITSPNDLNDPIPVPRYKVFLYLIGARPIGILLAERIGKANTIMTTTQNPETIPPSPHINTSIIPPTSITPIPHDAYMCIDRLWVHSDFRRKGIATALADQAREKFIPGLIVEKREMAISYPTSVGEVFAERYFGGVFESGKLAVG